MSGLAFLLYVVRCHINNQVFYIVNKLNKINIRLTGKIDVNARQKTNYTDSLLLTCFVPNDRLPAVHFPCDNHIKCGEIAIYPALLNGRKRFRVQII